MLANMSKMKPIDFYPPVEMPAIMIADPLPFMHDMGSFEPAGREIHKHLRKLTWQTNNNYLLNYWGSAPPFA